MSSVYAEIWSAKTGENNSVPNLNIKMQPAVINFQVDQISLNKPIILINKAQRVGFSKSVLFIISIMYLFYYMYFLRYKPKN